MTDQIPPQSVWRRSAPMSTLAGWTDAFAVIPILAHLEATARAYPGAPALIGLREQFEFAALLQRVQRIGAWLQRNVRPDQAVATLLAHTPSGIAAILGCVAAGRLTIPLNPADPGDRLAFLLDDAGAAVLLTDAAPPREVPARTRVLNVDDCVAAAGARPDMAGHDPDAPCMVHYTSGSSGRPKGIVISLYGILHRAAHNIDGVRIEAGTRVLSTYGPESSACPAMAVACLVRGAALLVASLRTDGTGGMLRLCAAGRPDVLSLPTPVLGSLLAVGGAAAALANVRTVRPGAAGMSHADYVRWRERLPEGCEFSYGLGSTEATRIAEWIVPADLTGQEPMLPLGPLSAGQEYALLGEDGAPVPDGAHGELVLRGRHIALGEWQAGRLVSGRMHPDPAKPGTRVFRTGDLLRFGADGMLRFVGRADRQVKINGVRVEPAEIEAVIRADTAVHDAVVVPSGTGGLHAFVAAPDADAEVVREAIVVRLRASLPPALRPRHVSVVANLPTLPGGKVDLVTLRRWAEKPEDRGGR